MDSQDNGTVKSKQGSKGKAAAAGADAPVISQADARLLVELLVSCGKSGNGVKPDWNQLSEKLDIASGGAAAKRVERLLKRFDYKMSDITGGKMRGAPSPKKTDSATSTPSGRKRKVKQEDDISPSAKRVTPVRIIKKEGVSNFKVFSVFEEDDDDAYSA